MDLLQRFREHPATVGETYLEHAAHAANFGCTMLRGSLACFVHAAFPWVHTHTASQTILRLHDRMVLNRIRRRRDDTMTPNPLAYLAEHI